MSQKHEGISCNACSKRDFAGLRYKCLQCVDYNSCQRCHDSGFTVLSHTTNHPMQVILTKSDYDIYYCGENYRNYAIQSFVCPICCELGLTSDTLKTHVLNKHPCSSIRVVCPLCINVHGRNWDIATVNLAAHFLVEHSNHAESLLRNANYRLRNRTVTLDDDDDDDDYDSINLQTLRSLRPIRRSMVDESSMSWSTHFNRQCQQIEFGDSNIITTLARLQFGNFCTFLPSPMTEPPQHSQTITAVDEQSANDSEAMNGTFTVATSDEALISGGHFEANDSDIFLLSAELSEDRSEDESSQGDGLRFEIMVEQLTSMLEAASQSIIRAEQNLKELEIYRNRESGTKESVDATESIEEEGL